ncbi:hypothetical protein C0995_005746 [Termitomyces sp. Mi166|nr:hypothetical protein C0995_005746 [Termitomyces sp. Mi166\
MTDPDNHCANRNLRANTVVVPPLHFESGGMRPGSMGSGGIRPRGDNQTAAGSSERPIKQPATAADPFSMVIPETVLPEGWDAPLQNPIPRIVPPLPAPALRRVRNVRQEQSLAILQEQQRLRHVAMAEEQERQQAVRLGTAMSADLEEDFNGLNPQNDIPPEEVLEYANAFLGQIVENALEYLKQPADYGDDPRWEDPPDDPAVHIPAEEVEPPLYSPPEMVQQLDHDQPRMALPRGRQPYLDEPPSHMSTLLSFTF